MKENIIFLILLAFFHLSFQTIPVWKFDGLAQPLYESSSGTVEKEIFHHDNYQLKKEFSPGGDKINTKNYIYTSTSKKEVPFEYLIDIYYNVDSLGTVLCPKGTFHPYKSDVSQYSINNFYNQDNRKWSLDCQKHNSGVFLAFYYNNGCKGLYGFNPSKDGGIWDGGNDFRQNLFAAKIKDYRINDQYYPILFLAKDGEWIKLFRAEQYIRNTNGESIHRNDREPKELVKIKENTVAYFSRDNDSFYFITYNKYNFSIGYSNLGTLGNYVDDNVFNSITINKNENLTFDFIDKVEILEMNFVSKTQNVHYSVKNTANGKIYHGIMDFKTQKVLFNIDEPVLRFEQYQSEYEILVTTANKAFKICLYQHNSECVWQCPSGTTLVINTYGNECKSTSTLTVCNSNIKLMPENICIEACDTNYYILENGECKLCKDYDSTKPYRIINTTDCLATKPEGTEDYNTKFGLLVCSKGYQLDPITKTCVTHCYPTCKTCSDYSENEAEQLCLTCLTGEPNEGNCEILKPTTIVTEKPTTIVTEKPTTIVTEKPTTIITEKPTTIVTEKPTTIITEKPTTIVTEKPTTIVTEKPTTIVTDKLSTTMITEKQETTIAENLEIDSTTKADITTYILEINTEKSTSINLNPTTEELSQKTDICSLEKCKKCSEKSLEYNLCLSCNEELGYLTVNYTTYQPGFVDCMKKEDPILNKFFYNQTTKEYRPCYRTCKKCDKGGNEEEHNCLECEKEYMFRPGDNPHNNCVVYSEYYYINPYDQFKSLDVLECPEEAKYLVKEKNYCIYDCKKDKKYKFLYSGNCVQSCPSDTKNVDFVCQEDPKKATLTKHEINILPDDNNYLKVVKPLVKRYVSEFKYTQNHISLYENEKVNIILYEGRENLKELSLDMPKVDFQNCSNKINDKYNLEGNALTTVVEKKNKTNPQTSYYFFHPSSGEQLEVENLCENETIVITENLTSFLDVNNTNFKLQMSLVEQGINIFDLNDGFYKDICYDFDNPNSKDIALRDRVRLAYPNAVLCEEGCRNEGIDLGTMTARCDCTFHDITQNKVVRDNEVLNSMVGEVFDIIDDSNILVVKCYKYIIKYFWRSYGGIITTIIIGLNFIFAFIFFCFQSSSIGKYMISLTKNFLKFLRIYADKLQANPPKKEKKIKIKEKYNDKLDEKYKEKGRKSKSKKSIPKKEFKSEGSVLKTKEEGIVMNNNVSEYQTTIDLLSEGKKLKNFFREYLETSPDDMEFDDAIKKDERSFCQYFTENLKENQIIANTFYATDQIKKRTIKLILFNLNLVLYIVINGLFFSEVYISTLYNIKEEEEHFFSFIPRSIDRIIYATLVSVIIGYLVDCFFVEEKKIIGIFKREQPDAEAIKVCILDLIKEIRRRYIGFIILVTILLLASLYYLLCFNYVYPKSQMEWIKSSIAIIIIIQILSVIKIFVGAVLRYLSFSCDNEYIFKFSKAFA